MGVQKLRRGGVPLLLLAAAQAFDVTSTLLALRVGGQESNPVLQPVLQDAGWEGLVAVKAGVLLLALTAVLVDPLRTYHVPAALWFATVASWAVVLWNLWGYAAVTGQVALAVAYSALGIAVAAAVLDAGAATGRDDGLSGP